MGDQCVVEVKTEDEWFTKSVWIYLSIQRVESYGYAGILP